MGQEGEVPGFSDADTDFECRLEGVNRKNLKFINLNTH
jgi:hypothetical protein